MTEAAVLLVKPPVSRPWGRASAWLAGLAAFFSTYGTANWLASTRADVPSIAFAWERGVPFMAWTIVPYWTINAFYAASLFVCADVSELDRHGRRLLTAQIVAVTIFVLWPLSFSWPQPATSGVPGFFFAALGSFDKPFNQAPSLHIALLVILWPLYAAHLPRPARWPLHMWFAVVGLSVLTTYQHHFLDIPTGALLGAFCLWLWPDAGRSPLALATPTGDVGRRRLAARYAAAAIIVAAFALWIGGTALWWLWLAVSLGLVSLNYGALGPAGFQKDTVGRMSLAARLLLAPYLLGAFANSRLWTRPDPHAVAVVDDVWVGRLPGRRDARRFAVVVDVCAELPAGGAHTVWRAVPMLDLVPPETAALRAAVRDIEQGRALGGVLVCCALGYSRSAAVVVTWLVMSGRARNVEEAIAIVRCARPRVVIDGPLRTAIVQAVQERAA